MSPAHHHAPIRARSLLGSALLAAASLAGCAQDGRGSSSPAGSASGSSASSAILADAVRKSVCSAQPCGSEASSIRVYRDEAGNVKKLYRLRGSCSHSPGIYFEPDGTVAETIPEEPITPGSDEERAVKAKHDAQVGKLKHTDTIECRDGSRSAP